MKTTQALRAPEPPVAIVATSDGLTQPVNANSTTPHASSFETDSAGDIQRGTFKRKRGRRAAAVPSKHHLEILRATKFQTYQEVAAHPGISRQRVGQIVQRFKHLVPVRRLPLRKSGGAPVTEEAPKKKEKRVHIISFRLTPTELQLLRQRYPELRSANHVARGILTKVLTVGNPTQ
jgi:hypothetical protein